MTITGTARLGPSERKEEVPVLVDDGTMRLSVSRTKEVSVTELTTNVTVTFRPNSYRGGGFRLITPHHLRPVVVHADGSVEWEITHR